MPAYTRGIQRIYKRSPDGGGNRRDNWGGNGNEGNWGRSRGEGEDHRGQSVFSTASPPNPPATPAAPAAPAPVSVPAGTTSEKVQVPVSPPDQQSVGQPMTSSPSSGANPPDTGSSDSTQTTTILAPAVTTNPGPQNTITEDIAGPSPSVSSSSYNQGQAVGVSNESTDSSPSGAPNYGVSIGIAIGITAFLIVFVFMLTRNRRKIAAKLEAKELYQASVANNSPENPDNGTSNWFSKRHFKVFDSMPTSLGLQTPSPIVTTTSSAHSQIGSEASANHSPLNYSAPVETPVVKKPFGVGFAKPKKARLSTIKEEIASPSSPVEAPASPKDQRESVKWFGPRSKLLRAVYSMSSDKRLTDLSLSDSLKDKRTTDSTLDEKRLTYLSLGESPRDKRVTFMSIDSMRDKNKSFLSSNSSNSDD